MLSSTESIWFETRRGFAKQLKAASIKVLMPAAFEPGDMKDAMLKEIRRSGIRIVLINSYDADTQSVASLALQTGMTTAGWAWLVTAWTALDRELVPGMAGWIWFRPVLASDMQAFAKQVSDYSQSIKSDFDIATSADSVDLTASVALYDAVMLYARAATKVLAEGGNLQNGTAVTEAIRSTTFTGVGGTLVALDSQGDRLESYEVINCVLEAGNVMHSVAVAVLDNTRQQYRTYKRAIVWPGKRVQAPVDYFSGKPWCMDWHQPLSSAPTFVMLHPSLPHLHQHLQ